MQDNLVKIKITNFRSLIAWTLAAFLLYRFVDGVTLTLLFFLLALILAIALDAPLCWLQKRGLSRGFSIAMLAVLLLVTIGLGSYFAVPTLEKQGSDTLSNIPKYITNLQHRAVVLTKRYPPLSHYIQDTNWQRRMTEMGQSSLPRIGRISVDVLSGVVALLLLIAVTFYAVGDPKPLVRGGLRALPRKNRPTAIRIYRRALTQIQAWSRATAILMVIVGVLSGLGLWAIRVPNPLLFGIVAGLGEAVPVVGPIISAVPPFLVMLATDPVKAVWVLVLFIGVQQIEGNLLVPRIMATAMELHPVPVLFCVVTMGALTGPIGLLLAIPLYAIAKIIYEETYLRRLARVDKAEMNRKSPAVEETDVPTENKPA